MDAYLDGSLLEALRACDEPEIPSVLHELDPWETALLAFLEGRQRSAGVIP